MVKHREAKELAQDHIARKWKSSDLNQGIFISGTLDLNPHAIFITGYKGNKNDTILQYCVLFNIF